jgi:hypothetical protein
MSINFPPVSIQIHWGPITSNRRTTNIVVSGPLANEVLTPVFSSAGVGPNRLPPVTTPTHLYEI